MKSVLGEPQDVGTGWTQLCLARAGGQGLLAQGAGFAEQPVERVNSQPRDAMSHGGQAECLDAALQAFPGIDRNIATRVRWASSLSLSGWSKGTSTEAPSTFRVIASGATATIRADRASVNPAK
jgi:hypothetical protein